MHGRTTIKKKVSISLYIIKTPKLLSQTLPSSVNKNRPKRYIIIIKTTTKIFIMFSSVLPKLLVTATYRKFVHSDITTVTTSNFPINNNVTLTNRHYINLSQAIHRGKREGRGEANMMK
jgi:hypothetical protein